MNVNNVVRTITIKGEAAEGIDEADWQKLNKLADAQKNVAVVSDTICEACSVALEDAYKRQSAEA
jgi:hypothetical protein